VIYIQVIHGSGLKLEEGVREYLHSFLTSAPVDGELSASFLGCFTPKEIDSHYPLNMRLGGAQNWSSHFEEKNLLALPGTKL
jgi:hypothetical protein